MPEAAFQGLAQNELSCTLKCSCVSLRNVIAFIPKNLFFQIMKPIQSLTIISLAVGLVACGGGSEPDMPISTPVNTQTNPPPSTAVPLTPRIAIQTAVPEPGFAPGSPARRAFDHLNQGRANCGFGMLRHNPVLDTPAANHARYYVANNFTGGADFHPHLESPKLPGYTAVWPTERAVAAGYKNNGVEVGEIIAGRYEARNPDLAGPFRVDDWLYEGIKALMTAPYHAIHAFGPYTEIGIAQALVRGTTQPLLNNPFGAQAPIPEINGTNVFLLGYGMDGEGQFPPTGSGVRTYPCEGTTDVDPNFRGEWTDPTLGPGVTPGRDLGINPLGTTILVFGPPNKSLLLNSATVTHVASGVQVPIYQLRTKTQNEPMAVYYRNDWTGYLMPDQPLLPLSRYRAVIDGTSGGAPFTTSFTFTTGNTPTF